MLKALELNGFKSFADRTRFEFPQGITAVVGPNGSGKSNVVDAIKWVLGSQSAKALRGKEMTDVIFSGARGRSQTNAAEVTLAFDNAGGILDYDADEVQITRRVYRSGEGEYLINRQPCRLRDIREVFAGTGVSTGVYSIIEQGKVDALLQSSPRERRLIFEEAAGVSRFKIKRQEAARRLERVDQNLLRLSDIVEELDSRLRSVRSQAGKARRYKQESDRLKLLRTQVALVDWRRLTDSLRRQQQQVELLSGEKEKLESQVHELEQQLSQAEAAADAQQTRLQQANSDAAKVREQIAQAESTRRSQLARSDELHEESKRLQKQLLTMTSRAGSAQQLVAETESSLAAVESEFAGFDQKVLDKQQQLDQATKSLQECRNTIADGRKRQTELLGETGKLENRLHALVSQQEAADAQIERQRQQLARAEQMSAGFAEQANAANATLRQSEQELRASQQRLTAILEKLSQHQQQLTESQQSLVEIQSRLTGAQARATVLEELERRLDGLSAGAKEVLRLSREQPQGPFGKVRGLVADLLHVDADSASLVETALGQLANALVIEKVDPQLLSLPESEWAGRTSFLRLDVAPTASAVDRIDLSGETGVVGRADQFVETAPDLDSLARRLLGRYWFVDNLTTAVRLSQGLGRGLSFVTVVGEVLGADGTLTVGPRQSSSGLLSRRSELRALVEEIEKMELEIETHQQRCSELEETISTESLEQQQLSERHDAIANRHNDAKLKAVALNQRLEQATEQLDKATAELTAAESRSQSTQDEVSAIEQSLAERRQELTTLEQTVIARSDQLGELENQVDSLGREVTDQRVALARCEQRRDGLRRQMEQLLRDHQEHDRALQETRDRERECRQQCRLLEQSVLKLSGDLAHWYHQKEQLLEELKQESQQNEQRRQQRTQVLRQVDQLRQQLLSSQSRLQQLELAHQQQDHQRTDLAERMKEDYGIELAVLASSEAMRDAPQELENREVIDAEIQSLKQKIQGLGPVNLEALSELEAVEQRHESLAKQYHDLRAAKAQLQKLVTQINAESRQIFLDSLEVIRGHFQELYSSLFGGGEADIVLDDSPSTEDGAAESSDPLECGIEIVARPPGKQLRSISLLSGGERTMTCVALLLAIFKSRPSPFCVLDEVDAALDEANIDRFVEVIKQFMSNTQFLVITHSKRTMSCADTLYGITMQESGVSKRVSVRFEDVSADGQIKQAA